MKLQKFLGAFLLVVLLLAHSGCSNAPGTGGGGEQLTFDYEWGAGADGYFVENDDIVTLLAASPYYVGAQQEQMPALKQFQDLKRQAAQRAVGLTDELLADLEQLENGMTPLKKAYVKFMDTAYAQEPALKPFAAQSAAQMTEALLRESALKERIQQTKARLQGGNSGGAAGGGLDEFSRSFLEYQKTTYALELADEYYQDLGNLMASAVVMSETFGANGGAAEGNDAAVAALDADMAGLESLNSVLSSSHEKIAQIQAVLSGIEQAEELMAAASLGFIQENVAELQAQLEGLTPSEGNGLTEEDVQFLKEYAAEFGGFAEGLSAQLPEDAMMDVMEEGRDGSGEGGGTESAGLIPVARAMPVAQAQFMSRLSSAYNALSSAGSVALEKGKYAAQVSWQGLKTTVQTGQKVVGFGLDVAGANTKAVFDIGFGLYNGNSVSDIADEVKSNYVRVGQNLAAGTSGSETLQTAHGYLSSLETGAQGMTADYVADKVSGKGWTSWTLGHVARLSVGMFTGFGKGVYKLANQQSTAGDYAEGTLDVAFSFIGGSKAVVKGSQLAKGGSTTGKLLAQDGLNFVQRTFNNLRLSSLKGAYAQMAERAAAEGAEDLALEAVEAAIRARQALAAELKAAAAQLDEAFLDAVKKGGRNVLDNLTTGVKGSFSEFVNQSFDDTIRGLKGALDNVTGTTLVDYVDNLFGGLLDDAIKGEIVSAVAASFLTFDGAYSGGIGEGEIFIPVSATLFDTTLTGGIHTSLDFEIFDEPIFVVVDVDFDGTVDLQAAAEANAKSAKVEGTLGGSVTADGETFGIVGNFSGEVNETALNITSITGSTDGDPWGPLSMVLTKE